MSNFRAAKLAICSLCGEGGGVKKYYTRFGLATFVLLLRKLHTLVSFLAPLFRAGGVRILTSLRLSAATTS